MSHLRFVSLDVETANSSRESICAIAVSRVVGRAITEEKIWFCRPPAGSDEFARRNVLLHKITAQSVENSPRFGEIWKEVLDFIGSDPLICHNTTFDTSAIRQACTASRLPWPELTYGCSMLMGRAMFPKLPNHKLPELARHCGAELHNHHDPIQDARAAAEVVIRMAELANANSIAELAHTLGFQMGWTTPEQHDTFQKKENESVSAWLSGNPKSYEPSPAHEGPLKGHIITFTGTMKNLSRQEAMDAAASSGAVVRKTMTMATTMLVTGDLLPEETTKTTRAKEMRAKGKNIQTIDTQTFMRLVNQSSQPTPTTPHVVATPTPTRQAPAPAEQKHETPPPTPPAPTMAPTTPPSTPTPVTAVPTAASPPVKNDRSTATTALYMVLTTVGIVFGVLSILAGFMSLPQGPGAVLGMFFLGAATAWPGFWWWRCHTLDKRNSAAYQNQVAENEELNTILRSTGDSQWAATPPQAPAPIDRRWARANILTATFVILLLVTAGISS